MFQYEKQQLENFLNQAKFPCSRDELIEQANTAKVPHQVVLLLQRLEDRPFSSTNEVEQEMLAHKA